jgi:hypothetical protein
MLTLSLVHIADDSKGFSTTFYSIFESYGKFKCKIHKGDNLVKSGAKGARKCTTELSMPSHKRSLTMKRVSIQQRVLRTWQRCLNHNCTCSRRVHATVERRHLKCRSHGMLPTFARVEHTWAWGIFNLLIKSSLASLVMKMLPRIMTTAFRSCEGTQVGKGAFLYMRNGVIRCTRWTRKAIALFLSQT